MAAVRPPSRPKQTPEDAKLTLSSFDESAHVYCWQIFVSGHWCGATADDRWHRNRDELTPLMRHCTYPHRVVERKPFEGSRLQFGPTISPEAN